MLFFPVSKIRQDYAKTEEPGRIYCRSVATTANQEAQMKFLALSFVCLVQMHSDL